MAVEHRVKESRKRHTGGCMIKKREEYLMEILSDRWNLLPLLNR